MTQERISWEIMKEVEAFLYAEARMLEDNRFDEWMSCFSDDVHYYMPVRQNAEAAVGDQDEIGAFALFDDDRQSLELRILRIKTGQAHAEVPFSVTQRFITNVTARPVDGNAVQAYSNFMIYQERRGQHGVTFYGRRNDILLREKDGFKIAKRKIELAQMILPTTISIFF
jgi:3-phenylpropionate/cinnamic acid dioxygenase small subunit